MDVRFSGHSFSSEQDDDRSSPESQPESPTRFGLLNEIVKAASSHKRRKATQKRVVSIPIKDSEATRFKGEGTPPPSDSWAWRKYGQKPIKGSPYPRGYYRCSSSKGCPARKQVERSRDDPTMLIITYSCEHNHPWPAPKKNHHRLNHHNSTATTVIQEEEKPEISNTHSSSDPELEFEAGHREKLVELSAEGSGSGLGSPGLEAADEFGWFVDMRMMPSMTMESPIFSDNYYHCHHNVRNVSKSSIGDADVAMFFPMREEDESLFSDLGELPECTVVFGHGSSGVSPHVQIC